MPNIVFEKDQTVYVVPQDYGQEGEGGPAWMKPTQLVVASEWKGNLSFSGAKHPPLVCYAPDQSGDTQYITVDPAFAFATSEQAWAAGRSMAMMDMMRNNPAFTWNALDSQQQGFDTRAPIDDGTKGWNSALSDAFHDARKAGHQHTADKLKEVLHFVARPLNARVEISESMISAADAYYAGVSGGNYPLPAQFNWAEMLSQVLAVGQVQGLAQQAIAQDGEVPETVNIRALADRVPSRQYSDLARRFDSCGDVTMEGRELEGEELSHITNALILASKAANMPATQSMQALRGLYVAGVMDLHVTGKVDVPAEYRNTSLVHGTNESPPYPMFSETPLTFAARMAGMDFDDAWRTGRAVFPQVFTPLMVCALDEKSPTQLAAVQVLASILQVPVTEQPERDLQLIRDRVQSALARFPDQLLPAGGPQAVLSSDMNRLSLVYNALLDGKFYQDIDRAREMMGWLREITQAPAVTVGADVQRLAAVSEALGSGKFYEDYDRATEMLGWLHEGVRSFSTHLVNRSTEAADQANWEMAKHSANLYAIYSAVLEGTFYEHPRAREYQTWLRDIIRVHVPTGAEPAHPGDAADGWRFGAQKGSVYAYPEAGGVQAGYEWYASTDPELVGKPEDQAAMEARSRRLADCATACRGMADPVAEVRALRVQAERAIPGPIVRPAPNLASAEPT